MLVEKKGDITILAPRSSVDIVTAPEIEKVIVQTIDDGATKLILDFSQVDYISSAGLRVVLITAKKLRKNSGTLILSGMSDVVLQVFELSGLHKIITLKPTLADALEALR